MLPRWVAGLLHLIFWPIGIAGLVLALWTLATLSDLVERIWCRFDDLSDLCAFSPETKTNAALSIILFGAVLVVTTVRLVKRWRRPGPRRTGRIIPLNFGYLWDDSTYPGLITPEKFGSLRKIALTEEELGKLAMAEALSEYRNRRALAQRKRYYTKISQFLVRKRERGLDSIGYWLIHRWDADDAEWRSDGLEIFTSYVDVLRYWRYPFSVEPAFDGEGSAASLVFRAQSSHLPFTLQRDDILRIKGTPAHFTMEVRGATWEFDWRDGRMIIIPKKATPASPPAS